MKSEEALKRVIEVFESENIPQAIAISTFPPADLPMEKWSRSNQILAIAQGTYDARGFKQWQDVGRSVKKGSKAIAILAPSYKTFWSTIEDEETGEKKKVKKKVLMGFYGIPVFRYEDTEGNELEYKNIELPEMPLMIVAEKLGLQVSAMPGGKPYLGYYRHNTEIKLCTDDESVFYHELAHAMHHHVFGNDFLKMTSEHKEIVAELCAAALGYLCGKKLPKTIGNHYRYIARYSKAKNPANTCIRVLNECAAVIDKIVEYATEAVIA